MVDTIRAALEPPLVVGIGGTVRPDSTSECALRTALEAAQERGARTLCLSAADLDVPFYDPKSEQRTAAAERLVRAFRAADALVISSPGYHGAVSGLVKNALDYVEDLVGDERTYFDGLPVGCVGVAYGSQAGVAVLANLRSIVHALRGYPTPYGAAVVARADTFQGGSCTDEEVRAQLRLVGQQTADFALQAVAIAFAGLQTAS